MKSQTTTTIVAHNYALHIHSDREQTDLASSSVKTIISQICVPRTYTCSMYYDSVLARDILLHVHVLCTHNKTIVVYYSCPSCIYSCRCCVHRFEGGLVEHSLRLSEGFAAVLELCDLMSTTREPWSGD